MVHVFFFFFYLYGDHRDLHSFPTRRSSDLASRIAVPGHTADSGALNTSSCELASMLPQEGAGGWMPRPRKLSAVSARIAPPTESAAATSTGPATLGATWRSSTRASVAPDTRAAATRSEEHTAELQSRQYLVCR